MGATYYAQHSAPRADVVRLRLLCLNSGVSCLRCRRVNGSAHIQSMMSRLLNMIGRVLAPLPVRGKGRLTGFVFRHIKCDEIVCHPTRGVAVHLRPDMRIERWMWIGAYEPRLVGLLKCILKPGMVFLDLGANIGFFSAIAAGLVGNLGHVYAFEPNPSCLPLLRQNLMAFPWATVCPIAAGDEAADAVFYQSDRADEDGWDPYSAARTRGLASTCKSSESTIGARCTRSRASIL